MLRVMDPVPLASTPLSVAVLICARTSGNAAAPPASTLYGLIITQDILCTITDKGDLESLSSAVSNLVNVYCHLSVVSDSRIGDNRGSSGCLGSKLSVINSELRRDNRGTRL